jgi:hypothetical protein
MACDEPVKPPHQRCVPSSRSGRHIIMQRALTFLAAALLTGTLATSAFAQAAGYPAAPAPATEYGEHHPYVEHFDNYLDKHPELAEQLRHNPSLINDPNYVSKHPELQEYLQHHPHIAAAFSKHPYAFMRREHRYERGENRIEHPGYGYVYDNNR